MNSSELHRFIEAYRSLAEALKKAKKAQFPMDSVVKVHCDQFKGIGIVYAAVGVPLDKIAVQIENGNVWHYPLESVRKASRSEWPLWIDREMKRRRAARQRRISRAIEPFLEGKVA